MPRLASRLAGATIAAVLSLLLFPTPGAAQFGIGARASTLGLGAEVFWRGNRNLGLRGGINYLEFSKDATVENIAYHLTPHFENYTAIADFFPTGGSFHLSGGVLYNKNNGVMDARLTSNIEIGNTTYTPSQVGSLTGTVDFRHTALYAGIGFSGRGRVSLLFDLGVGFTGKPRVDLVGTTSLTGAAKTQFDADVQSELAQIRTEIDGKSYLKYHPVLSLGLRIGL